MLQQHMKGPSWTQYQAFFSRKERSRDIEGETWVEGMI